MAASSSSHRMSSSSTSSEPSKQQQQQVSNAQFAEEVCAQFADSDGQIAIKKLKIVMRALGLDPRQAEVNGMTKKLLENSEARQANPDSFTASELAELLAGRLGIQEEAETDELHSVYRLFDLEGKGYILADDLRRVADELGEQIGEEELREMISVAEAASSSSAGGDRRGRVSEADFRAIMRKISLY